ncbi:MAG: homoserine O-succinyltransferase [Lachnospiraceae bacterium]|nr:homoserine O-succinyltransferase [Lachnospiraceae bacterium]
MPIKVMNDLPAKEILENENIFVMDENRSMHQDIRPLQIGVLNLMPIKQDTELQLLRALSNTPLQVDITFVNMKSHVSQNTAASHINKFYTTFDEIKDKKFDGFIITGAPIEQFEFEDVDYWKELTEIFDWTKKNVTSTLHICWGAQAGLYYHFGVKKIWLDKKVSGVYEHKVLNRKIPLVRGFDDIFLAPHSRHTGVDMEKIRQCDELQVLATSDEVGDLLVSKKDGTQVFVLGHLEYDRLTLDAEYKRDTNKGLNPDIPVNYYTNDDTTIRPYLTWRATSNCMYSNWLNYYVYQATPYDLL